MQDNVTGKISDERFQKMSARYEDEQHNIRQQICILKDALLEESQREASTDIFLNAIRKYTRAKKLTARMLNELVERSEVYHTEKIDGRYIQRLKIHYTCIGSFEIPSETISQSSTICLQTRKGVEVSYVPAQEAI